MKNSLSTAHPFSKIIFSLFIILVSFLLTFIIGFLIAIPLFQINISNLTNVLSNYNDPNNLSFLKYLQTIQAIGLFIVPSFIIAYLFNSDLLKYLKFNSVSIRPLALTIIILLASIPLINSLNVLNEGMQLPNWLSGLENWMKEKEMSAQGLTEAFLRMDSMGDLFFNIVMIGVLPAVGEELIFRGVLQRIFAEWTKNIHWGIIIAAALFSAMHMQFYGFLPRMILGVLLGYLFYWSGSIWVPILGHFVNNATAIIVYYFYADEMSKEVENFGAAEGTFVYLIIGLALVIPLLYLFYKDRKKNAID
jgi:CAAX protease family protein